MKAFFLNRKSHGTKITMFNSCIYHALLTEQTLLTWCIVVFRPQPTIEQLPYSRNSKIPSSFIVQYSCIIIFIPHTSTSEITNESKWFQRDLIPERKS